ESGPPARRPNAARPGPRLIHEPDGAVRSGGWRMPDRVSELHDPVRVIFNRLKPGGSRGTGHHGQDLDSGDRVGPLPRAESPRPPTGGGWRPRRTLAARRLSPTPRTTSTRSPI